MPECYVTVRRQFIQHYNNHLVTGFPGRSCAHIKFHVDDCGGVNWDEGVKLETIPPLTVVPFLTQRGLQKLWCVSVQTAVWGSDGGSMVIMVVVGGCALLMMDVA